MRAQLGLGRPRRPPDRHGVSLLHRPSWGITPRRVGQAAASWPPSREVWPGPGAERAAPQLGPRALFHGGSFFRCVPWGITAEPVGPGAAIRHGGSQTCRPSWGIGARAGQPPRAICHGGCSKHRLSWRITPRAVGPGARRGPAGGEVCQRAGAAHRAPRAFLHGVSLVRCAPWGITSGPGRKPPAGCQLGSEGWPCARSARAPVGRRRAGGQLGHGARRSGAGQGHRLPAGPQGRRRTGPGRPQGPATGAGRRGHHVPARRALLERLQTLQTPTRLGRAAGRSAATARRSARGPTPARLIEHGHDAEQPRGARTARRAAQTGQDTPHHGQGPPRARRGRLRPSRARFGTRRNPAQAQGARPKLRARAWRPEITGYGHAAAALRLRPFAPAGQGPPARADTARAEPLHHHRPGARRPRVQLGHHGRAAQPGPTDTTRGGRWADCAGGANNRDTI